MAELTGTRTVLIPAPTNSRTSVSLNHDFLGHVNQQMNVGNKLRRRTSAFRIWHQLQLRMLLRKH